MSDRWVKYEFPKLAGRWYRLYANLINSGYKTLPVLYEGKFLHTIIIIEDEIISILL